MKYGIYLDTADNLERDGKNERVEKAGDGLEHRDVLGKRTVPDRRRMKVLMRTLRAKMRSSVIISDRDLA